MHKLLSPPGRRPAWLSLKREKAEMKPIWTWQEALRPQTLPQTRARPVSPALAKSLTASALALWRLASPWQRLGGWARAALEKICLGQCHIAMQCLSSSPSPTQLQPPAVHTLAGSRPQGPEGQAGWAPTAMSELLSQGQSPPPHACSPPPY